MQHLIHGLRIWLATDCRTAFDNTFTPLPHTALPRRRALPQQPRCYVTQRTYVWQFIPCRSAGIAEHLLGGDRCGTVTAVTPAVRKFGTVYSSSRLTLTRFLIGLPVSPGVTGRRTASVAFAWRDAGNTVGHSDSFPYLDGSSLYSVAWWRLFPARHRSVVTDEQPTPFYG